MRKLLRHVSAMHGANVKLGTSASMNPRRTSGRAFAVFAALLLLPSARPELMGMEALLAKGGQAEAVIVVGRDAGDFDHWVAGELQRYVKQLSGAELPIVATDQCRRKSR